MSAKAQISVMPLFVVTGISVFPGKSSDLCYDKCCYNGEIENQLFMELSRLGYPDIMKQ